tara:strand:- start:1575 stop:2069 length:495 start_codon:yes stop_codon:yes gene_type:complete
MGKSYKTSSKPYLGMRGMDFSNPRAVDNYQRFPKSCKFCSSNTRARDLICYQCKRDGLDNLNELETNLLDDKQLQMQPSGRVIDSDAMLERFHKGWIELGDGSLIEVTQTAREMYNSQEMRERKRRQYILRELMNAKYCKRINGCTFKPFTKSECKCYGSEEEQ